MTYVPRPLAHFALSSRALDEVAASYGVTAQQLARAIATPAPRPAILKSKIEEDLRQRMASRHG